MDKTLTIRLDGKQQELLGRTAKRLGKTVSELVREILQQALSERPLSAKTGQLKGRLTLTPSSRQSWRRELKARNWRP